MATVEVARSPKTVARLAGVFYFLIGGAAFNEGYVLSRVVKPGDAGATADNIRASATLFRIGFLGDLTAGAFWLLAALALHALLGHVDRKAATAMVTFAAVGAGIQILNQLNQYTALTLATGPAYQRTFGRSGADGLALLYTDIRANGYAVDALFFGLWLLPLGYLVFRSGNFPKVIGVLVAVAGCGYLADLFVGFLAPDLGADVAAFVTVPAAAAGELTFMVWLLVKGVRTTNP